VTIKERLFLRVLLDDLPFFCALWLSFRCMSGIFLLLALLVARYVVFFSRELFD